MKFSAMGLLAAGALSVAIAAAPTPSQANPFVVPLIVGAVIVGWLVVAGAANANENRYRRGGVSVGPDRALECRTVRIRLANGALRRRQVCD